MPALIVLNYEESTGAHGSYFTRLTISESVSSRIPEIVRLGIFWPDSLT